MCTVLLPPGGYPIAVNKYIIKLIKNKVWVFASTPPYAFVASMERAASV
jgi:hypothetical protein